MAASVRSVSTGSAQFATATVALPAGTVAGDLLVAICFRDEGSATSAWTTNPFTLLGELAAGSSPTTGGKVQVWTRTADGSEPASFDYTESSNNSTGTATLFAISGAGTPTMATQNNTTASTSMVAPSIGSPGQDPLLLCAWDARCEGSARTITAPGTMTPAAQINPTGTYIVTRAAHEALTGSGATGTRTATVSAAETSLAVAVAIPSAVTSVDKDGFESLTLTDAATVTVPVSAAESLTITDAGQVGIPTPAADSASISETLSIAADLDAAESAEIVDSLSIAGTLGAAESATILDTPAVGPLALDAATVTDAMSELVGHLGVADPFVVSDGAAIETLFGDLVVALFAVDPVTGALTALPDHKSLTLSRERNGAGSISLAYPVDGDNFPVLRDSLTADRDLEVEIWTIGQQTGALRGFLQEASGDDVVEDRTWTFAGGFAELLIGEAVAWPAPIITITTVITTTKLGESSYQVVTKTTTASSAGGPAVTTTVTTMETSGTEGTTTSSESTNGDLEFEAVTPGELAIFLVGQAQARGGLTGLTVGFSATHDSAGTPWPSVITSKFSPGSSYDSVLARLVDFGLSEWGVTWTGTAYRLDLWVIFGRGIDRTVGSRPVVLRKARNLLDAPRKWSVRDSGTAILAAGAEGVYEEAADVNALARRGRRIERSASANNLTDPAAVQGFAQNQLVLVAAGELEVNHGIGFLPGEPRPVIAFDIGDWIYSQSSGGLERLRVVSWTLGVDEQRASGTVTLNDTITDALSKLQALIDNLTSGDTVVGTSESSGGQDSSTPLPPQVVSAESVAFLDGTLGVRAAVTVALDMPVLNVDGTVITDMESVVVQYALASSPDVWNAGITKRAPTSSAVFTTVAGQTINIRAAIVDRQGNTSVWSDPPFPHTTSDDDLPPPVPSAAVVSEFLGTVRITWDGLTDVGADMQVAALDFDHVEVHLSTGSLFTPSDATRVGQMFGRGTWTVTDLPYGVTQFARFVAVDWSDNKSAASGQGSATPAQVVSADVFDGAIGSAKLADLAVTTAKINDLAVNDAKIGSLSVGKLTAGSLQVDVILAAGGFKTATSGTRVALDSAGLRLYNSSNIMVDLKTSNGSALVVGEFRTALSGQRVVFNPGGALPDTLNFYPNAAGDFARIMARTAPADGSAAILIDGGAANGTPRGRVGAYGDEAFISHVTGDAGGDTSAGFSTTAVSASANTVLSWVQTEFDIDKYSGINRISGSRYIFKWTNGEAGSNVPTLVSENNSGIKLDSGAVAAVNGAGSGYVPMLASSFTVSSSRATKTDEAAIGFDAEQMVRLIEPKQWRYLSEVADNPDAPLHFGPIAEDVAVALPALVTKVLGISSIDIRDMSGVLWDALRKTIARVDALESQTGDG